MTCRNCGAEIADKALICYRCGTATTEAKYRPAPLPSPRAGSRVSQIVWIVVGVLAALAAAAYFFRSVG